MDRRVVTAATLMVDGFCHRCGKPLGKVAWDAADFVFHRKCAKAEEVYTPSPAQVRAARFPRTPPVARFTAHLTPSQTMLRANWRSRITTAPAACGPRSISPR